ncbi:MAG: phage tail tape measure protein [Polyangiaceae bacterium]|nr:phage tail tape measure protein [Polyangiaceae bacterium]MCL4754350.1 phage tail tape measure protein [Myxococcales bacterium]
MAEREARVRLSLVAGGYLGGLQQVTAATKAQMASLSTAMGAVGTAGLRGMRGSLAAVGSELKGTLTMAAKFGGIFGAGAALTKAGSLQSTYRDLAFSIERATGEATKWQNVQQQIEPVAMRTGRSSQELADAFKDVLAETGDAKLAAASIGAIGVLATASGRSVGELSSVAGALNDKLGVTAKEMPDALAAAVDLSNKGGIGFEDLTKAIHMTGASARAAGLTGAEAFGSLIALMNKGGDALGSTKKGLSAITQLMDQMADPSRQKEIKQSFGVSVVNDKTGEIQRTETILAAMLIKTGGQREKLAKVFKGEQLKLVTELAAPFREAFEKTKGDVTTKTEAGLRAFNDALKRAGTSSFKFADAQSKAVDRMEDPQRKLALAMETFAQEFTKPAALEAMNELTKHLPKVATGFAKIVSFAVNNPLAAGGAYVGARMALGFASGALAQAGTAIGTYAAAQIRASAAAAGPWKTAGAALGIAAAAYLAYKLGKDAVDDAARKDLASASDLAGAATAGSIVARGSSVERKQEALKLLKERVSFAETERSERKTGIANKLTFGAYSDVRGMVGEDELAKAKGAIRELEQSLAKGGKSGDRVAESFERAAAAADKFAQAAGGAKPGGNNGLPPSNNNTPPGYLPR